MVILNRNRNLERMDALTVQALLYPTLILIIAVFLLATVPRSSLRRLIPYGIVLGGLIDVFWNMLFDDLLNVFRYTNLGIFDASGQLFLAPLAWSLIIVSYLYFWPSDNSPLRYFYVLAWAFLATGFSQLVRFAGLFEYRAWYYPFPMLILFVIRFALIAQIAKPWTNS